MIVINDEFDKLPVELKESMFAIAKAMGDLITKRMLDVDESLKAILDKPEGTWTADEETKVGHARMACLQGIHKGLSLHVGQIEMTIAMILGEKDLAEVLPMLRIDSLTHIHKGHLLERNNVIDEAMVDGNIDSVTQSQKVVDIFVPITRVPMGGHPAVKEMVEAMSKGGPN